MGRTLPSITQIFHMEEESLSRFRRALRRGDQLALDRLFTKAQHHLAAAGYAAHSLPMEIFMISMMLELEKTMEKLAEQVAVLNQAVEELKAGDKPSQ